MSRVIDTFTTQVPTWRPYVTPIDYTQANDAQRDALTETPSNTQISDYVLVLAHDPQSLKARTPLFNNIMYSRGGLSRAERELGAVGASVVNRCVYCAAVHASRYNQLTKNESHMAEIFAASTETHTNTDITLPAREQAIVDFAMRLSKSPPTIDTASVQRLREVGLSAEEIVDLILSSALFGWANRLMHTLGEPIDE